MRSSLSAPVLVLALLVALPQAARSQARLSVLVAPAVSAKLRDAGNSSVGAPGVVIQVLRQGLGARWAWGASAAIHTFGTYADPPAPDRRERSFALGVRGLRGNLRGGWFTALGLDLLAVQERPTGSDWSTDPGVGAYLGAGWIQRAAPGTPHLFAEAGLTGALATGESTAGGGIYLGLRLGLAF